MRIGHLRDGASICRAYRASDFGESRKEERHEYEKPEAQERANYSVHPCILRQTLRGSDKAIYAERKWNGHAWAVAEPDHTGSELTGSIVFVCNALGLMAASHGGAGELQRLTMDGEFVLYEPSGRDVRRLAASMLAEFSGSDCTC